MIGGPESESHFKDYVQSPEMVCFFGKTAFEKERVTSLYCLESMRSSTAVETLLPQIYRYIQEKDIAHIDQMSVIQPPSLVVKFPHETQVESLSEAARSLFTFLVNLHQLDKAHDYSWSSDVSSDPHSDTFSFSLGGEAFFLPFLYPQAYAPARRAPFPTLVLNTHRVFELLRKKGTYGKAKELIRKEQMELFGFVPELLADHGADLEFPQYLLPSPEDLPEAWRILHEIGGEKPFG